MLPHAVISGCFAALSSFLWKLLFSDVADMTVFHATIAFSETGRLWFLVTVLVFFAICNFLMWSCFTTAISEARSVAACLIFNTLANYIMTALLGYCVFREKHGHMWYVGIALILVGCFLVHDSAGGI